jgi:hypothetical protein
MGPGQKPLGHHAIHCTLDFHFVEEECFLGGQLLQNNYGVSIYQQRNKKTHLPLSAAGICEAIRFIMIELPRIESTCRSLSKLVTGGSVSRYSSIAIACIVQKWIQNCANSTPDSPGIL